MISSTGYPIFVAKIFAVVLARLAGDEIIVSPEIEDIRINECLNCVYITGNTQKTYRCKLCKCFIQLKIKTAASKCPINKW